MAVKLRLMRMGKKKQPTYRVVAADSRSPRNGRFIEIIGTYEPRRDPSVIKIDNERAVHWLRHGAQPSERVEKLLKISGAWTEHTGEAIDTAVPASAPKKSAKQLAREQQATEAAAAPPAAEAPSAEGTEATAEAGEDAAETSTDSERSVAGDEGMVEDAAAPSDKSEGPAEGGDDTAEGGGEKES